MPIENQNPAPKEIVKLMNAEAAGQNATPNATPPPTVSSPSANAPQASKVEGGSTQLAKVDGGSTQIANKPAEKVPWYKKIGNWFSGAWDKVKNWWSGSGKKIAETVGNLAGGAFGLGGDIGTKGVGMIDKAGDVVNMFKKGDVMGGFNAGKDLVGYGGSMVKDMQPGISKIKENPAAAVRNAIRNNEYVKQGLANPIVNKIMENKHFAKINGYLKG